MLDFVHPLPIAISPVTPVCAALHYNGSEKGNCKGHPAHRPEQAQGVPGRLRARIFLTFGTTRVVGRQP